MAATTKMNANNREDILPRNGATKNLSRKGGRAARGVQPPRRRLIVAATMADARWNPGAVAKETAPIRKGDGGRERKGAPPPEGGRAGLTRRRR